MPNALAPADEVNVTIGYKATFNTSTSGKKVLFMKKNGIAAAYRWIPWLSRQQKYSTPNFGESWITGNSPRVTVTLTLRRGARLRDERQARRMATATAVTFTANNVRDFNFAASPDYQIKKTTWKGIKTARPVQDLGPQSTHELVAQGHEAVQQQGRQVPVRPH